MNQMLNDRSCAVYESWLASAAMPPVITRELLTAFDPADCFDAFQKKDEKLISIVPSRYLKLLDHFGKEEQLKHMADLMESHSIYVMKYDDPEYPDVLKEIESAPAVLFYQGNVHCLKKRMLAMVGSRAASYAGQKAAKKLSGDLSRQGVSIVSGLACGIDAASHLGCLEGGSPTIAVTACGLDTVYPKDNTRLRDDILSENGLILTEYAPGEKAVGWHFPYRNRIIAGLGKALILIEAKIRSGSMTSVHHALDQGKDVFVYPGDPSSQYFEGNHQLLREGGIYFTSAEDILSDLHWLDNQPAVRQNSDCSGVTINTSPEQKAVLDALKPGNLSFEQLLDKTHLSPAALMSTLTILQIGGQIESLPGKLFQIRH